MSLIAYPPYLLINYTVFHLRRRFSLCFIREVFPISTLATIEPITFQILDEFCDVRFIVIAERRL